MQNTELTHYRQKVVGTGRAIGITTMRLFVAIDLPDTVKDQLDTLPTRIPTARWMKRQQMHLTLFFLGETDRIPDIKDALASVKAPPFSLSLAGVGRFPQRQKQPPRVLWVGIDAESALDP
jgi:2'-5' RNA ligase